MSVHIVTGASSGLGRAIANQLARKNKTVVNLSIEPPKAPDLFDSAVRYIPCDLSISESIEHALDKIDDFYPDSDISTLINCAGINHIDYIENLPLYKWEQLFAVNVTAPFLLVRSLIPALARSKGTVVNIISNASHMPMTGSLAYNATKGALHIMTLQMARELTKRHGITVFGISPNKMEGTQMSQYIEEQVPVLRSWTPEFAAQYQRNSLLTGRETKPEECAQFIVDILSRDHTQLSGCVLPYGA